MLPKFLLIFLCGICFCCGPSGTTFGDNGDINHLTDTNYIWGFNLCKKIEYNCATAYYVTQTQSNSCTGMNGVFDTLASTKMDGNTAVFSYTGTFQTNSNNLDFHVSCDSGAGDYDVSAAVVAVTQKPGNTGYSYQITGVKSKHACAGGSSSGGLTWGAYFLIILTCLIFVYLVGGFVFNMYKRELRGKEAIPNLEFWTNLGSLVVTGLSFVKNKILRKGY
eukprot:NODE_7410_length_780_cov_49.036530_g6800_i0.p1 GENE.NODE_7410_length_780_cov_49.036530_g6800_i0~~NODE_7410_length_780_cov_49.036530_g6800_i0.p1  ORF type:complete len:239 (+),score=20.35 NODE_7410_length_780_cov_49.036530_g6800_i0:56-718(+)